MELIEVDPESVMPRLELDEARVREHERLIPRAVLDQMWQCAADAVLDRHFGLHAAVACINDARASNATGTSMAYSGSPAIGKYARVLLRQLQDSSELADVQYRWVSPSRSIHLEMFESVSDVVKARHRWEYALATCNICLHALLGQRWEVAQVWFQHSAAGDALEYQQIFGVEPLFDQPCHGLVLCRVGSRVSRNVGAQGFAFGTRQRVALELKRLLECSGGGRLPSLEEAARRMGIGPRTLQRRLHAEGTSHRALTDEVRNSLAEQLLAAEGRNVADVACRLGFSEPTAFRRAFKRWSGKVPSEARRTGR